MDDENPAVTAKTRIPPALLDEAGKDPKVIEEMARKIYFVNLDRIQRQISAQGDNVPLRTRLDYMEHVAKIGQLGEKKAAASAAGAGAPGFSISIVLPQTSTAANSLPKVEVIEAADTKPPEQLDDSGDSP